MGEGEQERRERTAVYDGWWRCETLEDVEEHERLVDRCLYVPKKYRHLHGGKTPERLGGVPVSDLTA